MPPRAHRAISGGREQLGPVATPCWLVPRPQMMRIDAGAISKGERTAAKRAASLPAPFSVDGPPDVRSLALAVLIAGIVYPGRKPGMWERIRRRGRRVAYQEHGANASD